MSTLTRKDVTAMFNKLDDVVMLRSLPGSRNQSFAAYAASLPLVDSQLAMRIEQNLIS